MNAIENVVRNAGWLDKCPEAIECINPQGFSPEIELPGSKWSTLIKTARDAVLALRGQHLPVNEQGEPLEAHNFIKSFAHS
jgi:hypothetical protein